MKKLFFAMLIVGLLIGVTASLASANAGPHGGYSSTDNEEACAGCHRAHTATAARLLTDTAANLCASCHGAAGSGANTNVDNGVYLDTRDNAAANEDWGATLSNANTSGPTGLNAGGFVQYGAVAMTSNHGLTSSAAWGNTDAGGANDRGVQDAVSTATTLTCVICHDPHGNSNYRMLQTDVDTTAAISVTQVDEGVLAADYNDYNWSGTGLSSFCAACHEAYHQTAADVGSDAVEAANGGYTHQIDMPYNDGDNSAAALPSAPLAGTTVVCTTCHFAHGSAAQMSAFVQANDGPSSDSAMLRFDNRGVCQDCHQK